MCKETFFKKISNLLNATIYNKKKRLELESKKVRCTCYKLADVFENKTRIEWKTSI